MTDPLNDSDGIDLANQTTGHRFGSLFMWGVGQKLLRWMFAISLLPLLVMGWFCLDSAKDMLRQDAENLLSTVLELKSKQIKDFFAGEFQRLNSVSFNRVTLRALNAIQSSWLSSGLSLENFVKSSDWSSLQTEFYADLWGFQQTFGYQNMLLINLEGEVLYAVNPDRRVGSNLLKTVDSPTLLGQALRTILERDTPLFSGWEHTTQSGDSSSGFILHPIVDERGDTVGLLAVQMMFDTFGQILATPAGLSKKVETYLVGSDCLLQPNGQLNRRSFLPKQVVDTELVRRWIADEQDEPGEGNRIVGIGHTYKNDQNIEVLGKYAHIHALETVGVQWALIAEISVYDLLAPLQYLKVFVILFPIMICLLVFPLASWLAHTIAGPIGMLRSAALQVGLGNFDVTMDRVPTGEMGELVQAFRQMLDSMQARHEALDQTARSQLAINEIFRQGMESRSLEKILQDILKSLLSGARVVTKGKGAIFLWNEEKAVLEMVAHQGLSEHLLVQCACVPVDQCLCGRVAKTGKLLYSGYVDTQHTVRYDGMQPHGHYCVPILAHQKLLGVVNLYLREDHPRDSEEEDYLWFLSRTLASIIVWHQTGRVLVETNESLDI